MKPGEPFYFEEGTYVDLNVQLEDLDTAIITDNKGKVSYGKYTMMFD